MNPPTTFLGIHPFIQKVLIRIVEVSTNAEEATKLSNTFLTEKSASLPGENETKGQGKGKGSFTGDRAVWASLVPMNSDSWRHKSEIGCQENLRKQAGRIGIRSEI